MADAVESAGARIAHPTDNAADDNKKNLRVT
jgi:hypothetical protein